MCVSSNYLQFQKVDLVEENPLKKLSPPLGALASLRGIFFCFKQEQFVFFVTCIYLVFEYNRPQLIYPAIDILPWGKTLLFLAIFLAFFDKTSKKPPTPAIFSMTAFSICVLWSTVFAFSPSIASDQWVSFFGWVFVVLLLTSVVNTKQRLFLFIGVYFFANFKMAQHGFRTWAMNGFGFSGWGVSGSPGWFQNSGEFSLEMVVFIPFIIAYIATFRHDWSFWVRMFFYSLLIMSIGSIIACNSRGGILGLILVGLWCLSYSRQRFRALIILIIVSSSVYWVTPQEFKARFEESGKDNSSLARLAYWECGKEAIKDNLFTGVGFKNWVVWVKTKHPELAGKLGEVGRVEVIHNTYMEAATELGLPGLVVYAVILLYIFSANFQTAQRARAINDSFLSATAAGLNGSLLGYLAPSYFMSVLYYPYIWIILSLTVCVSTISCSRGHELHCKQFDNKIIF